MQRPSEELPHRPRPSQLCSLMWTFLMISNQVGNIDRTRTFGIGLQGTPFGTRGRDSSEEYHYSTMERVDDW